MRQLLRILFAAFVIAFAASMLAVSCGKTAGGNNNNNNSGNNSGNNGGSGDGNGGNNGSGGSGGCTGICPTTNLILKPLTTPPAYVKVSGNTVTINAAGLAGVVTPHSDANPDNRGLDDTPNTARAQLFVIEYPSARAVMFFVNRASVSTNNITMPATIATCPSNETTENTRATGVNGICRVYTAGGNEIDFRNYLGTVFNNTDTANRARGTMVCNIGIANDDPMIGGFRTITDTITFNRSSGTSCSMAVVNSAGGAAMAEIDDAWVTHAASTTEVELHGIGINISGKTIPQFSSETGYNLARFITAHDNAAFKKLLQNNNWGELKFKVKIVTAANF